MLKLKVQMESFHMHKNMNRPMNSTKMLTPFIYILFAQIQTLSTSAHMFVHFLKMNAFPFVIVSFFQVFHHFRF